MPQPIPQPFTYIGLPNAAHAPAVKLTDNNIGPIAGIWLLMMMNPGFSTDPNNGLTNAAVGANIARILGITHEALSYFVNYIIQHYPVQMNNATLAFQAMVQDPGGPGYVGASCPGAIGSIGTLLAGFPPPTP